MEALGNHTFSSPTGVGGSVASLQIPSMAYRPSSVVSRFSWITPLYNLNDWWSISDGAFLVIRCTISLKTTKNINTQKRCTVCFDLSVAQSMEGWVIGGLCQWWCGSMEVWVNGYVSQWRCGSLEVWVNGSVG